jgi:hypothetical protein
MNPGIRYHFERLEQELCNSPAVREYHILMQEVAQHSGQVRVRINLVDGGLLELFEYVTAGLDGVLAVTKYRYHWQDQEGNVVQRWDNAVHHPRLPHAPHHVHQSNGGVKGVPKPPDVARILAQIEKRFSAGGT